MSINTILMLQLYLFDDERRVVWTRQS